MLIAEIIFVCIGLAVLLIAGDLLVRGAVSMAAALRVPMLLVSLTVVAFGTSAPELVVSIQAVTSGNDGIALGNIIGSNIANILLVLGLPAIIYPISTHVAGLRRNAVFLLLATVGFAWAAYDPGQLNTLIGAGLFVGILCFITYTGFRARCANTQDPILDEVEDYQVKAGLNWKTLLYVVAGLVGLPLGAHLLVVNGSAMAAMLGVREEIIGLTIIAFGTSLPELATVFAAALHKKSEVAIGGVIGSNIFNTLAVGGAAGLAGTAVFTDATLRLDLPVMILTTLLLALFCLFRRNINCIIGIVFVAIYAAFILALATASGAA